MAVLAFVVLIPPLVERFTVSAGLSIGGANRIIATGLIFIAWTAFASLLVRINSERFQTTRNAYSISQRLQEELGL
jgi:hypothetical protein